MNNLYNIYKLRFFCPSIREGWRCVTFLFTIDFYVSFLHSSTQSGHVFRDLNGKERSKKGGHRSS